MVITAAVTSLVLCVKGSLCSSFPLAVIHLVVRVQWGPKVEFSFRFEILLWKVIKIGFKLIHFQNSLIDIAQHILKHRNNIKQQEGSVPY